MWRVGLKRGIDLLTLAPSLPAVPSAPFSPTPPYGQYPESLSYDTECCAVHTLEQVQNKETGDSTQHNQGNQTYSVALGARRSSNPSFSRHTLKTRWAWITRCPTRAWASLKQIISCCLSI